MVALTAVPVLVALTLAAPVADPATTLALDLTSAPGGVAVVARATTDEGAPASGSVLLRADGVPLATLPLTRGRATLTTDALPAPGVREVTATWLPSGDAPTGAGEHGAVSTSVTWGEAREGAAGGVALTIPSGVLTLTAPTARPAGGCRATSSVVVTDTRAGDLGFDVSLTAARPVGKQPPAARLVRAAARQVPGNGLRADGVRVARPGTALGAGRPVSVAHHPAGVSLGSVGVVADVAGCTGPLVWTVL